MAEIIIGSQSLKNAVGICFSAAFFLKIERAVRIPP
jgi:hypothetical protein